MVRKPACSVSEREHWISAAGDLAGMLAAQWLNHALLGSHAGVTCARWIADPMLAAASGLPCRPWPSGRQLADAF
jgi:hypothetical protein